MAERNWSRDDGGAEGDKMRRRPRFNLRALPDDVVFEVCDCFTRGEPVSEIVEHLARRGYRQIGRQQIYPLIHLGLQRRFIELCPPPEREARTRLGEAYPQAGDIHVVNVTGPDVSSVRDHVAAETARLSLKLIKECPKRPVHVGFGAGRTVKQVAWHLARLLHREAKVPDMVLHALGSGFSAQDPTTSANVFLAFFAEAAERSTIVYEAMVAETFVKWSKYGDLKQRHDVRRAFEEREKIDIVITTATSRSDPHGLLNCFMRLSSEGRSVLEQAGWVGDVLWRPYCRRGPILQDTDIRAVSVLELSDLVEMARARNKHVVLAAAPSAVDEGPLPLEGRGVSEILLKTDALRPLLTEPTLRVCNHLVLDVVTAKDLLHRALSKRAASRE